MFWTWVVVYENIWSRAWLLWTDTEPSGSSTVWLPWAYFQRGAHTCPDWPVLPQPFHSQSEFEKCGYFLTKINTANRERSQNLCSSEITNKRSVVIETTQNNNKTLLEYTFVSCFVIKRDSSPKKIKNRFYFPVWLYIFCKIRYFEEYFCP